MNTDIETQIEYAIQKYKDTYISRGICFTHEDLVKTVIDTLIDTGTLHTIDEKELELKQLRKDVWFSSDYGGNNKYKNVNEIVDFLYTGKQPDRFNT